MIGLYASLLAGGLMLAYAIWYVTVVNVDLSLIHISEPTRPY